VNALAGGYQQQHDDVGRRDAHLGILPEQFASGFRWSTLADRASQ